MIAATDLFAGCGGSSIGFTAAGGTVKLALDHWHRAVETHSQNFSLCINECVDISNCNPRKYPRTEVLMASPECTHHSISKGKKRDTGQLSLFEEQPISEAADRSRATMWEVPRWCEIQSPLIVIVENVVEAMEWVYIDAWFLAMQTLDYQWQILSLNYRFFPPTPQSRDRIFVVFWKKGITKPNLDFRPPAICFKCDEIQAIQTWKNPHKRYGKYKQQYYYRCPLCYQPVEPKTTPAYTAIDWSIPIPTIGERSRPLKQTTINRIKRGLIKLASPQPFVLATDRTHNLTDKVWGLNQPLPTQTTRQTLALTIPPFIASYYSASDCVSPLSHPIPTITTHERHALICPPPITETNLESVVSNCGFRMLDVREIQSTMGFPHNYTLTGTKREQIKQLGNAVTPPVMEWIAKQIFQVL